MFAESKLTPTEVEKGLWYYQGIDEVGNLYPDEAFVATMLGAGNLSSSAEHVGELRKANTVTRRTKSSSRAAKQQSSVPSAPAPAPVRSTRFRFLPSTQTVVHDAEHARGGTTGQMDQQSPVREVYKLLLHEVHLK